MNLRADYRRCFAYSIVISVLTNLKVKQSTRGFPALDFSVDGGVGVEKGIPRRSLSERMADVERNMNSTAKHRVSCYI